MSVNTIGQIVGFFAMASSITSFQMKTHKRVMIVQFITAILFAGHYYLIGAVTAGVLNVVSAVRDAIFINDDKKWAGSRVWLYVFLVVYLISGILTYQNIWSILVTVAMLTNTLAFYTKTAASNRKIIFTSAPLMLIYNIITLSIGGIINETLSMTSSAIAVARYDIKDESFMEWFKGIFTTIGRVLLGKEQG